MELNAEQIVYCLKQDIKSGFGMKRTVDVTDLKSALALINDQEQRIEKLERLCKLREQDHNDALDLLYKEEEKNEELAAENERLRLNNAK